MTPTYRAMVQDDPGMPIVRIPFSSVDSGPSLPAFADDLYPRFAQFKGLSVRASLLQHFSPQIPFGDASDLAEAYARPSISSKKLCVRSPANSLCGAYGGSALEPTSAPTAMDLDASAGPAQIPRPRPNIAYYFAGGETCPARIAPRSRT